MSRRYVHPTAERLESAVAKLDADNGQQANRLKNNGSRKANRSRDLLDLIPPQS